jgi:hypothetical protein
LQRCGKIKDRVFLENREFYCRWQKDRGRETGKRGREGKEPVATDDTERQTKWEDFTLHLKLFRQFFRQSHFHIYPTLIFTVCE